MAIEQCLKVDNAVLDYGGLSELGRSYTREFTIKNDCEHSIQVSGKIDVYEGEGASASNAASEWLTFVGGENKFELGTKASKNVAMRVYVPEKATPGSYYATVTMKNESSEQHDEEFGDIVDLAVRMDILGAGSQFSGALDSNYALPISFGGHVASGAKLRNTGSVGYQVSYKLERSNAFGMEDFQGLANKTAELPAGGELELKASEFTEGQYGIYKLRQTVDYVNGEGQRVESVLTQTVINLPWVAVFIAGGCLFALILLGIIVEAIKLRKISKREDKEEEEEFEEGEKELRRDEKEKLERPEPKPAKVIDKKAERAKKKAEKAKLKAEKAAAKAEKVEKRGSGLKKEKDAE